MVVFDLKREREADIEAQHLHGEEARASLTENPVSADQKSCAKAFREIPEALSKLRYASRDEKVNKMGLLWRTQSRATRKRHFDYILSQSK